MNDERITYFGLTDARNKRIKFGIKAKDRTKHVYIIGKTGMGKSTLLENMAVQDIANGDGMCFIDPHGKTADFLLEYVPKDRIRDVIYIAPFDTDYPISFNVLESVSPEKRHLVVSGLMSTFKKIWVDAWSARMEYILTNTLLALLECPGSTLLGVNRMLSDKAYRAEVVAQVHDPSVKAFWVKEFASYTERMAAEAVPAIQNKVGQFTANPLIRNMIGQPRSSFDFREAMDKRKIIIINLSKGKIGDENMKLLGGLLVTKIYLAAMSRADVPDRVMKMLPNFYLYVDEFQNFANASFADILSEARKYKLNLTIAHQYIEQMDELVRPAVFGNVGTMITFRVGATDAEALEKEFSPQFVIEDLVNLGFAQIYLKLMIDGLSSAPFSANTMPPIVHPDVSYVNEIIAASREQFAKPRAGVEVEIVKFHEPTPKPVAVSPKPSPAVTPKVPQVGSNAPVGAGVSVGSKPVSGGTTTKPAATIPATPSIPNIPKPQNATTKPFANLKEVIAKVAPKPQLTQESSAVSVAPATPIAPIIPAASTPVAPIVPPAPKPIPLSALASKPVTRPDSKGQSPQNVNDLKNALFAAMSKNHKNEMVQTPASNLATKPVQVSGQSTTPIQPESPKTSVSPVKPISSTAKSVPPPTQEVPEDVLHDVLKLE